MTTPEMEQFYDALRRYPAALTAAFESAQEEMDSLGDMVQQVRWAQEGVRIAQQTARAWEASAEYFRASPRVTQVLSSTQFLHWVESGVSLCRESPTVSAAFFRATPMALSVLPTRHLGAWAELGRSLCKGTWKSSSLASHFFDASPDLLNHLALRELESLVSLVTTLSDRSYDLASECLYLAQRVLPTVNERAELLSLAGAVAAGSWREVRGCFESAATISSAIEQRQRAPFLTLTERLARQGMANVSGFILESSHALAHIPADTHGPMLELANSLTAYTPHAVGAFLKSLPWVLERVSTSQVEVWFQQGVDLLEENPDAGVAYFKLESSRAEHALELLSSSIELERVKAVLSLYSRALAGSEMELLSTQELTEKMIGWVAEGHASTDGKHIFLPPVVDQHGQKSDNFAWLKVVTTHQLGHLEFGSFQFEFHRLSTLFEDLRPKLAAQMEREVDVPGFSTDMSRFFDLFAQRQLASDIFAVAEDARVDTAIQTRYLGLVSSYQWVLADTLEKRPPLEDASLWQAMVEILVRMSLDPSQPVPVPFLHEEEARAIAGLLKMVQVPSGTVEDSAEATIRIYSIITSLPNMTLAPEDLSEQDLEDAEYTEGDTQQMVDGLKQVEPADEQDQQDYQSPEQVDFRGEFKPELVQMLAQIRSAGAPADDETEQAVTQDALQQLLMATAEIHLSDEADVASLAMNLMKEQGVDVPDPPPGGGYQEIDHQEEKGGSIEVVDPRSYVYDEWDFRANDYRPRWCVVQEKQVLAGDTRFFTDTLQNYAGLMGQIRRHFEAVRPEMHLKVKHLAEGEDVDLDSGIEALIDIRLGVTPDEEIYWRRNKVERDVGVVFLLDMSASTAEAVEEVRRDAEWEVPSDPTAYAAWLRVRRGDGGRRQYKRIIDVEKESMVLLMTALEMIGDQYGVYGFSGFGRENVEFYVVKDLKEPLSEQVKRRLDKVSPLHATRMGPAIRHATTKLAAVQAKSKFLFLISDGRPQDRGYSREGVEKEYAVQDTRMALVEARQKDIMSFCLTVDRQGQDYLRSMAVDMAYEVLPDVMDLPRRLPYLYRRLTL